MSKQEELYEAWVNVLNLIDRFQLVDNCGGLTEEEEEANYKKIKDAVDLVNKLMLQPTSPVTEGGEKKLEAHVDEVFEGLKEYIKDKEIFEWYKSLIVATVGEFQPKVSGEKKSAEEILKENHGGFCVLDLPRLAETHKHLGQEPMFWTKEYILEAMHSYANQGERKELIKEIWNLWESMAECGELQIGPKFSANYKALKERVAQHLK